MGSLSEQGGNKTGESSSDQPEPQEPFRATIVELGSEAAERLFQEAGGMAVKASGVQTPPQQAE